MISVLMPYRGAGTTIADAAESVLADLARDDELVAIDDGSRDEAPDVMRAMAARDARVVLVDSGGTPARPAGIVAALTRGLEVARGSLVGRMDADDVTLPGRFARERELLESDESLGAVGVGVSLFPTAGDGMIRYVTWQNALVTPDDHARAIFVESPLCHPSTLIRRSALARVGGFRESPWAEDYDLWLRLDAAGFRLAKVHEVLFRWRMRTDSLTWTDARYAPERYVEARAHYLAARLAGRPYAMWGAGPTGRRLARALEAHGTAAAYFIDIDPRKIGRIARGVPIVSADDGIARARAEDVLVVVAVGRAGARDEVKRALDAAGLREREGYVCAA